MNMPYTKKQIRIWALVMSAALAIVGGVQFLIWSHIRTATILWIIGALFLLLGLFFPMVLKPIFWLWMKFAAGLGWLNTRIILALAYFLMFTPIGLVTRLFGVDLIKQRWDRKAESYWVRREDKTLDRTRYENQY
ncbi:MAG: SxtJ family membrane protein [bacterium]